MKIKLIDFRLSKAMGYEDTAFGVDLWSLGITIYYVMFHRFPVKANDKSSLKEKIPKRINADDLLSECK